MAVKIIETQQAPRAPGMYSQAVAYGDLLFVSGQLGIDPATGDFVSDCFADQVQRAFKNLNAIVEQAGSTLKNIIKLNVSIVDIEKLAIFNSIMPQFLSTPYPARAVVGVHALPRGALVEIEAIVGMRHES